MNPIYEKMKELEAYLEPLLTQSESWLLLSTTTSPVNYTEEVVARSLRSMARIKLNRCVQLLMVTTEPIKRRRTRVD